MALQLKKHLWSIEQYHQAIEAGIFTEEDPFELIRGKLIEMTPIGRLHANAVFEATEFFGSQLRGKARVWAQNPISLKDIRSEPQPDIVLVCLPRSRYAKRLPAPEDIFLVIEVSDFTIEYDLEYKLSLYAEAGIRETWILHLQEKILEVYREPSAQGYREARRVALGQTIAPLAFPELAAGVHDFIIE
jgi:Uma2 family endonuclease